MLVQPLLELRTWPRDFRHRGMTWGGEALHRFDPVPKPPSPWPRNFRGYLIRQLQLRTSSLAAPTVTADAVLGTPDASAGGSVRESLGPEAGAQMIAPGILCCIRLWRLLHRPLINGLEASECPTGR